MPYVSARYVLPMPGMPPMPPDAPKQVLAVDDEGREWSLTDDSQVGDWLRYIEGGGTIDMATEPKPAPTPPPAPPPPPSDPPIDNPYDGEAPVAEPNVVYGDPLPE